MFKKSNLVVLSASLLLPFFAAAAGIYPSSTIGFDVSYATKAYPATDFHFGIVSVTRGKAFAYNDRLTSEYSWAKFGSGTTPTLYMNLNAPYGKTVAGHIDGPQSCLPRAPGASATSTEPTACEGYNYGYNAAQDAYAYARGNGITSPIWWLDIETENSWSNTVKVNDATIQGAIDSLNMHGVRVGIYSMHSMWNKIAGKGFAPSQTINGSAVSIPIWLPVGIKTLVGAINSCITKTSFIPGGPIWLIQYVANATAIDQNVAC